MKSKNFKQIYFNKNFHNNEYAHYLVRMHAKYEYDCDILSGIIFYRLTAKLYKCHPMYFILAKLHYGTENKYIYEN